MKNIYIQPNLLPQFKVNHTKHLFLYGKITFSNSNISKEISKISISNLILPESCHFFMKANYIMVNLIIICQDKRLVQGFNADMSTYKTKKTKPSNFVLLV